MAPTGLLDSFVAAVQASLAALLVIFYGGIAAHLNLLTPAHSHAISKICVQMFLPALLFTHIGAELHTHSASRYLIVFIWALICHLLSFLVGIVAHIWLGMPDWTTVAVMFSNTTSYPLLLIAALDQTGILKALLVVDETTAQALVRAKSYFLVFATVGNCLAFAVGPRLIDSEHAPEASKSPEVVAENDADSEILPNEESGLLANSGHASMRSLDSTKQNSFFPTGRAMSFTGSAPPPKVRRAPVVPKDKWSRFSPRAKWWILFISDFFNAPLLGAILGAFVGLIHPLHKAFFYHTTEGGFLTAWLTSSLQSIGSMFVPLPVLVAGVSLYNSMKRSRTLGAEEARMPWLTVVFVLCFRFVVWPVISIATIHALARHTHILGDDPMLWFAMMLMPTGPPAMKLITLVQVSDGGEEQESAISKLLTISYLVSPVLSFTVVGAMRATETVISAWK